MIYMQYETPKLVFESPNISLDMFVKHFMTLGASGTTLDSIIITETSILPTGQAGE